MNELERLNAQLSEAKDKFKQAQKNHHQAAICVFEANENLVKCQRAFNDELKQRDFKEGKNEKSK